MDETYTIKDYLQGKVRGFEIPDMALRAICTDAGIAVEDAEKAVVDTPFDELTERQKDLSVAYTYLWLAQGPVSTAKWSEKDGDWSQSGGGEQLTPEQIRTFIRMANAIFDKYGLPKVGFNRYKVRGGGFRNIRDYGRHLHR